MSIKLKDLVNQPKTKKEKVIAEGFFSKLKSLFGSGGKTKVQKLKKNKKFMKHVKDLNNGWDNVSKMLDDMYGEKVDFHKFTADDFK